MDNNPTLHGLAQRLVDLTSDTSVVNTCSLLFKLNRPIGREAFTLANVPPSLLNLDPERSVDFSHRLSPDREVLTAQFLLAQSTERGMLRPRKEARTILGTKETRVLLIDHGNELAALSAQIIMALPWSHGAINSLSKFHKTALKFVTLLEQWDPDA